MQCSAVHYSAAQRSAVHYSAVHYSALQCITVHYSAVRYGTVWYAGTEQNGTEQYSTEQYSTILSIKYSTEQYTYYSLPLYAFPTRERQAAYVRYSTHLAHESVLQGAVLHELVDQTQLGPVRGVATQLNDVVMTIPVNQQLLLEKGNH